MSDQWYYRMFGEEFGPVPLDKLKELAEFGSIQATDEVRAESSDWVLAESLAELGLARDHLPPVATNPDSIVESATAASASDDWYCLVGELELGPLSFEELLSFAEQGQLSADDQVKRSSGGKWRRAGSIGRLVAVLPYSEKPVPAARPAGRPRAAQAIAPVPPPAPAPAPAPPPVPPVPNPVTESLLAQADATYRVAEELAQSQVAWMLAPNIDRHWWTWIDGAEVGPIEFSQLLDFAISGRLKTTDFVRNGPLGQYVPATNVPGLLNAASMIVSAAVARDQAKALAASMTAPAPVAPAPAPAPAPVPAPAAPTARQPAPAVAPVSKPPETSRSTPAPQPRPKSDPSGRSSPRSGSNPQIAANHPVSDSPEPVKASLAPVTASSESSYGSNSASIGEGTPASNPYAAPSPYSSSSSYASSAASRPAPAPKKPAPRASSPWLSDMIGQLTEQMKNGKALGAVAAILFALLFFGWGYLPKSRGADIKHYQALKQILDDIRLKRSSSPAELESLKPRMEQVSKEVTADLKDKASRDDFAKQCLLWAARDEIPKMIAAGLDQESAAESNFAVRLKEASYELGLEKRPPLDMAQASKPPAKD